MSTFSKLNEAIDQIQSNKDVNAALNEREAEALRLIIARLCRLQMAVEIMIDFGSRLNEALASAFESLGRSFCQAAKNMREAAKI